MNTLELNYMRRFIEALETLASVAQWHRERTELWDKQHEAAMQRLRDSLCDACECGDGDDCDKH